MTVVVTMVWPAKLVYNLWAWAKMPLKNCIIRCHVLTCFVLLPLILLCLPNNLWVIYWSNWLDGTKSEWHVVKMGPVFRYFNPHWFNTKLHQNYTIMQELILHSEGKSLDHLLNKPHVNGVSLGDSTARMCFDSR